MIPLYNIRYFFCILRVLITLDTVAIGEEDTMVDKIVVVNKIVHPGLLLFVIAEGHCIRRYGNQFSLHVNPTHNCYHLL